MVRKERRLGIRLRGVREEDLNLACHGCDLVTAQELGRQASLCQATVGARKGVPGCS